MIFQKLKACLYTPMAIRINNPTGKRRAAEKAGPPLFVRDGSKQEIGEKVEDSSGAAADFSDGVLSTRKTRSVLNKECY